MSQLVHDQPIDCQKWKMVQNLLMVHHFLQYFDLLDVFVFLFYFFFGFVVLCLILGCLLWIDNLFYIIFDSKM